MKVLPLNKKWTEIYNILIKNKNNKKKSLIFVFKITA